jgi:hypothetical protein
MSSPDGYWLSHFGAYLQTERILSDLFTVIVIAGVIGIAATFLFKRRWRWRLGTIGVVVAVLLLVGAAYATVGKQFRASCLHANDALAAAVPVYRGARLASANAGVDYNNGDAPLHNYLSFTHLLPLAWNYDRRLTYSLPAGTTQAQVLRFYASHFRGWHAPQAEGQLPDFWWRGRQAVQVACTGTLGFDSRVASAYEVYINGWNRPAHY